MKNISLIFLIIFLFNTTPVMAVTATSSATTKTTPTPTTEEEPTAKDSLLNNIKTIVQQNLSTTEAKLKEKINQGSIVGYAGKVTSVTSTSVNIDSYGELFQVVTTETTAIINASQKVKLSSIAIGDKLIVIGVIDKNNILEAKRIVVVKTTSVEDIPTVYSGKIVAVDSKKRTISLLSKNATLKLIISKKLTIKPEKFTLNSNAIVIVRSQDAGLVITAAKIL